MVTSGAVFGLPGREFQVTACLCQIKIQQNGTVMQQEAPFALLSIAGKFEPGYGQIACPFNGCSNSEGCRHAPHDELVGGADTGQR